MRQKKQEAVTLQQNSLTIVLHETLLDNLDAQIKIMNWQIVLKRFIGIILTIIVATLSAVAITALIYFEDDVLVPAARDVN